MLCACDHHRLLLILQSYSRLGTPTLSQISYFQCRNFIIIVVQHMLAKAISYKVTFDFQFLL